MSVCEWLRFLSSDGAHAAVIELRVKRVLRTYSKRSTLTDAKLGS